MKAAVSFPPATPSVRKRIWTALRILKSFDVLILSETARVPTSAAREFLRLLTRGGYVQIVKRGNARTGCVNQYRLIRNTGPNPPRRCLDTLLDGNNAKVFVLAAPQNTRRSALNRRAANQVADQAAAPAQETSAGDSADVENSHIGRMAA